MIANTTIVIGGGPAGLLAAARLAGAGVAVTLLEAKAGFGGRAASEHRDGFDLNQGPHALYAGGAGMRELRALGVDPPRWNPTALRTSVLLRGGRARRVAAGPHALAQVGRWTARIMRGADGLQTMSTAEWIAGELSDPAAREAAGALVRLTTFVADHERLSADVAAAQIRLALYPGVRYVRGGWQSLVDALAVQARRRGATMQTRTAVRALEPRGIGWTIITDDGEHEADAVIVAAGRPEAVNRLIGDRVAIPGPPAEVSALDLGLRRLPKPSRRFGLGIDEPTYSSVHTPRRDPAGDLLSLASYGAMPEAGLEAVADTVQPGWRDELLVRRHLARMVAVSAIATPATGGLAGRPGVAVPDAPGLFVAGDWIGAEGWLSDAALASGAEAARALVRAPRAVPA